MQKSSVIFEVAPLDDTVDMSALEEMVREIGMEGLVWKGSALVPLAYGIEKLSINAIIVDDLVSADELVEKMEALELVQSVTISVFVKV